ncbi:MAG TPA: hypothetical protein VF458_19095 [Ktedonobacteraceae bacterium]
MAKQCIFCGRLLAKEDALFCNECGRSQVEPAGASGAESPSAIKVKLPPKEFTRVDPSPVRREANLSGPAASITPLSSPQHEQTAAPSSRMPKRPTHLAPSTPEAATPANAVEAEADAFAAMARLADSVKPSMPTPAEEVSTMILPNWREELAQLRKEQEKGEAGFTATPGKQTEKAAQEPPALPRHAADNPSRRGANNSGPQTRSPEKTLPADLAAGNRVPQNAARTPELPRKTPSRPLPRDVARAPELPRKALNTPLPQENTPAGDPSRRELRVKVWEQEETIVTPQMQVEPQVPGSAPAVEQNPLARAKRGAEEKVARIEDLETAHWQAPPGPIPASSNQPVLREEKRPEAKKEGQPAAREESRSPARGESARPGSPQGKDGIEDQPTLPLALSEIAKQEPQIKIERASTPAPKKWTESDVDKVEDLPTRPMAASPAPSRAPQQTRSMDQQAEASRSESGAPPTLRAANPPSMPGVPGAGSSSMVPPQGQSAEMLGNAPASRGRPASPHAQPGSSFNPASLPPLTPLPQGPASLPGNPQLHSEIAGGPGMPGAPGRPHTPFPDPFSPRPPQAPAQRPPSFEPASTPSTFSSPNVSSRDAGVGTQEKPRRKKRTRRVLVTVLVILVIAGIIAGPFIYNYLGKSQDAQAYQTYQNSTFNISLHYTPGWNASVDQKHSTIHFHDNTNTDQVNLVMSTANGQVGDYLNQQATQLGVTSPKAASAATIAGTNWQALQGTVTQSGATFTIELYAAEHKGHFYLLEFLAPQVSFNQADQSHFAQIRSSFSFL